MTEALFPRERLVTEQGIMLTKGLFYEYRFETPMTPVYTLKEIDWKGHVSMYRIYMESGSEYEAAQKLLGSWNHWLKLCGRKWFQEHVEAWREEKLLKEVSIGKAALIKRAQEGSVSAAKELIAQMKVKETVGRPSNKEKEEYERKMQEVDKKVVSILERAANV